MSPRDLPEGTDEHDLQACGSCGHLGSEHLDFDFGSCCVGSNDTCDCEQFQEADE